MALASSTEVPPNFMTIIGAVSSRGVQPPVGSLLARDPSLRRKSGSAQDDAKLGPHGPQQVPSSQVPFGFQQFSVENACAGGTANRVVREHRELPVKHAAGTQTTDGGGHTGTHIYIEARLRTVTCFEVDHRLIRS